MLPGGRRRRWRRRRRRDEGCLLGVVVIEGAPRGVIAVSHPFPASHTHTTILSSDQIMSLTRV